VELANALTVMTGTTGWKMLMEKFIKPHSEYSTLMTVPDDKLAILRAEHRTLYDMIRYIEKSIEIGMKSHDRLLKNK
jgi:hypothetical protein